MTFDQFCQELNPGQTQSPYQGLAAWVPKAQEQSLAGEAKPEPIPAPSCLHEPERHPTDDVIWCRLCHHTLLTREQLKQLGLRRVGPDQIVVDKDCMEDLVESEMGERRRAMALADECGRLDGDNRRLLADNAQWRMRAERAERKVKR